MAIRLKLILGPGQKKSRNYSPDSGRKYAFVHKNPLKMPVPTDFLAKGMKAF